MKLSKCNLNFCLKLIKQSADHIIPYLSAIGFNSKSSNISITLQFMNVINMSGGVVMYNFISIKTVIKRD